MTSRVACPGLLYVRVDATGHLENTPRCTAPFYEIGDRGALSNFHRKRMPGASATFLNHIRFSTTSHV